MDETEMNDVMRTETATDGEPEEDTDVRSLLAQPFRLWAASDRGVLSVAAPPVVVGAGVPMVTAYPLAFYAPGAVLAGVLAGALSDVEASSFATGMTAGLLGGVVAGVAVSVAALGGVVTIAKSGSVPVTWVVLLLSPFAGFLAGVCGATTRWIRKRHAEDLSEDTTDLPD